MNAPGRGWPHRPPSIDGDGLRTLDWQELCARLLAADQLRQDLDRRRCDSPPAGSFDRGTALGIAAMPAHRPVHRSARQGVNLDPSPDGKAARDTWDG